MSFFTFLAIDVALVVLLSLAGIWRLALLAGSDSWAIRLALLQANLQSGARNNAWLAIWAALMFISATIVWQMWPERVVSPLVTGVVQPALEGAQKDGWGLTDGHFLEKLGGNSGFDFTQLPLFQKDASSLLPQNSGPSLWWVIMGIGNLGICFFMILFTLSDDFVSALFSGISGVNLGQEVSGSAVSGEQPQQQTQVSSFWSLFQRLFSWIGVDATTNGIFRWVFRR